ncbi:MAG: substrate-binding domain-containing protein [Clostridiales bacterium]|jgi:methyl-galactoside transport system substrate-binding protein|nr:substrate-binding domain-containing protein [Clostridiales bacterium]
MKKLFSLFLVLTMVLAFVPAAMADDPIEIGVISYNWANTFQSYLNAGFRYWNEQYDNVNITLYDGENDQSIENDKIDIMLNKGIDVLCCNLVDTAAAPTVIEKCRAAGVPIVFYNKMPAPEALASYDHCLYVGVTTRNQGKLQGEFYQQALESGKFDTNGDGKLQYVMIQGQPGHSDVVERYGGFKEYLDGNGIPYEELDAQTADWDAAKAKSLMETWIGKYGETIEIVFAQNDAMAIAAVEALRGAGLINETSMIPVVGINALPETSQLIKDGFMLGSVLTNPTAVANASVDLAIRAVETGATYETWCEGTQWVLEADRSVRIPDVVITAENVDIAVDAYKR